LSYAHSNYNQQQTFGYKQHLTLHDTLQLAIRHTALNPPTAAIWVQLWSILWQTRLSRHL